MLSPAFLCGQTSTFINYNQSNSLPSNEAYYVYEDHQGFIWMLTDNGAVRFDGHDFMLFNKQNGMADNVNFSVHEDSKHRLWFRSYSGALSFFDGTMNKFNRNLEIQRALGKSLIGPLLFDEYDSLHFGFFNQFMHFDSAGNYRLEAVPDSSLKVLAGKDPTVALRDNFATIKTVIVGSSRTSFPVNAFDRLTGSICVKNFGNGLLISVDRYLFMVEKNHAQLIYTANSPIISLSPEGNGLIWIGLQAGGAMSFDGRFFRKPTEFPFLDKLSVTSVLSDKNGGFWISTLEKGVFFIPNRDIVNYLFPSNSKLSAVAFGSDRVYLGNYDGWLYQFNLSDASFKQLRKFATPIISLYSFPDREDIIVSTSAETYLMKAGTGNNIPVRETWPIKGIKKFQAHNQEVLGGNFIGLIHFSETGDFKLAQPTPVKIRSFFVDDNGEAYLAPVSGLVKSDLTLQRFDTIATLNDNKVLDVIRVHDKLLIATAESGVLQLKGDSISPYFAADELPCPLVRMILKANDKLYLATDCGLYVHNIGGNHSSYPVLLNAANGLLSNGIDFLGFADNKLLCFSPEGVSMIDTSRIAVKPDVQFYLKETLVNNAPAKLASHDLTFNRNNIRFNFGFVAFSNRNIRVKHRPAEAFGWSDGNISSTEYFSLSPGNYWPELQYSVNGGPWVNVKLSDPFTIKPAWWETIYFQVTVVLAVSTIVGLIIFTLYNRRLAAIKLQAQLRQEKDRISRELHDNIGSKLAFIKISLSTLNNLDEFSHRKDQIEIHLNSAVHELRDTIWAINKEEVPVLDFVDRVRLMLSRLSLKGLAIDFSFSNSSLNDNLKMDPAVAVDLFRIIQEAVNNSIKHSGATKIAVELGLQLVQKLSINIKDDGVGFNESIVRLSDGYGLFSMKQRAEKLGADFQISSIPGSGTEIRVTYRLSA